MASIIQSTWSSIAYVVRASDNEVVFIIVLLISCPLSQEQHHYRAKLLSSGWKEYCPLWSTLQCTFHTAVGPALGSISIVDSQVVLGLLFAKLASFILPNVEWGVHQCTATRPPAQLTHLVLLKSPRIYSDITLFDNWDVVFLISTFSWWFAIVCQSLWELKDALHVCLKREHLFITRCIFKGGQCLLEIYSSSDSMQHILNWFSKSHLGFKNVNHRVKCHDVCRILSTVAKNVMCPSRCGGCGHVELFYWRRFSFIRLLNVRVNLFLFIGCQPPCLNSLTRDVAMKWFPPRFDVAVKWLKQSCSSPKYTCNLPPIHRKDIYLITVSQNWCFQICSSYIAFVFCVLFHVCASDSYSQHDFFEMGILAITAFKMWFVIEAINCLVPGVDVRLTGARGSTIIYLNLFGAQQ